MEEDEKDIHVLLDFQGKDVRLLKQPKISFRILNLDENKPIVEVNDDIYEGTYDDAIGTNVFFEEEEGVVRSSNVFEGTTPIALKYLLKQTKIVKMKKIGIKSKLAMDNTPIETVNIQIQDDYKELLNKIKKGELNIDNYICHKKVDAEPDLELDQEKGETEDMKWESAQTLSDQSQTGWYPIMNDDAQSVTNETNLINTIDLPVGNDTTNPTYLKYLELKQLAEQPTKHKSYFDALKENKFEQPLHFLSKSEFFKWKKHVMNAVEKQAINLDIKQNSIEDYVDVEKSIKAGIVGESGCNPRIFTEEEKAELLSFKNFINLSVLMKFIMLHDLVQMGRTVIKEMTEDQQNKINEDGCSVQERLDLLKTFRDELKNHIISRLQEENECNNEEEIRLLSDDEDLSESDSSYLSDETSSDSKLENTTNLSDTEMSIDDNNSSFDDNINTEFQKTTEDNSYSNT